MSNKRRGADAWLIFSKLVSHVAHVEADHVKLFGERLHIGAKCLDFGVLLCGESVLEILDLVSGHGRVEELGDLDRTMHEICDLLELLLGESTSGHGGSAHANTSRHESALVTGDGILVGGDADILEHGFDTSTIDFLVPEIDEQQMIIGSARDDFVSEFGERISENLAICDDLFLIGSEFGALSLFESDGESGDCMVVRTALMTRENGLIDFVFEIVANFGIGLFVVRLDSTTEKDHGTTRTTQ